MKTRQSRFAQLDKLRWWALAVAAGMCPIALPALAQPWSGGSALGVQIRGSDGPVAGAVVEIRYRRPGLSAGPEARRTDTKGQANFVGITPGRWSLEVRHPDYLSFVASVDVGTGRKTEVVTQFLEASGPGRKTFKVKFLRTDRPLGEAVPGTSTHEVTETEPPAATRPESAAPATAAPPRQRVAPREAPPLATPSAPSEPAARPEPEPRAAAPEQLPPAASAEPLPRPVLPAEPDPEPSTSTNTEAPGVESAAPAPSPPASSEQPASEAPVPTTAPEPEGALPTVSEAEPVPGVASSSAEPTAAPSARPSPPEVAPPAGSPAEPAPAFSTDPGAEASPEPAPGSVTAFRDRTCFDCKPGEWAAAAEIAVPAGEPCRTTGEVAVRRAMRDVAAAVSAGLDDFAGALPTDLERPPLALASAAARNTLARYLDPSGACRLLAVVVPAGGKFTGFRLEARDSVSAGDCPGEQECEIGGARFLFSPVVARGTGAEIVYSVFENTGDELRTARITGYFLPPPGWSPQ